jgi:hypothetical protein
VEADPAIIEAPVKSRVARPKEQKAGSSVQAPSPEIGTSRHRAKANANTSAISPQPSVADVSSNEVVTQSELSHDKIAALAHSYWAERGYAHGSADEDWLRAEQKLKAATAGN